jgi:hypothetical protein
MLAQSRPWLHHGLGDWGLIPNRDRNSLSLSLSPRQDLLLVNTPSTSQLKQRPRREHDFVAASKGNTDIARTYTSTPPHA